MPGESVCAWWNCEGVCVCVGYVSVPGGSVRVCVCGICECVWWECECVLCEMCECERSVRGDVR